MSLTRTTGQLRRQIASMSRTTTALTLLVIWLDTTFKIKANNHKEEKLMRLSFSVRMKNCRRRGALPIL
jgi:hypothetical protein